MPNDAHARNSGDSHEIERTWLSCCFLDPECIDKGLARGLTERHYTEPRWGNIWSLMLQQRMANGPTDCPAVGAAAVAAGCLDRIGGWPGLVEASGANISTTSSASSLLTLLLDGHARREAWKLLATGAKDLDSGAATLADVVALGERISAVAAGNPVVEAVPVKAMAEEAIAWARDAAAGKKDERPVVATGLPNFDRVAGAIHSHEYVVVAARSSHGKSSLALQIAGHNLARGKKVAIFTLETSASSVVRQMAAQRAGANLRDFERELPERQNSYIKALEYLAGTKSLLVYDTDLSITQIQSRCRALSRSFRPDLVIIDYLGLITGFDGSNYERASAQSKAMIPLRKMLGCTLIVAAQLNQQAERDGREPNRTDFRDSGAILEDAHRVIAVHRDKDQPLDNTFFTGCLLQLKNRDGGLAKVGVNFNARCTRFSELSTANEPA